MREFDREIASQQGRVAVISFAGPDQLKRFAGRLGHPFLWLADPGRISYKRLGLGRRGLIAIAPPRAVWGYIRFFLRGRIWHPEQTRYGADGWRLRVRLLRKSHAQAHRHQIRRPPLSGGDHVCISAGLDRVRRRRPAIGLGTFASRGVLCRHIPRLELRWSPVPRPMRCGRRRLLSNQPRRNPVAQHVSRRGAVAGSAGWELLPFED